MIKAKSIESYHNPATAERILEYDKSRYEETDARISNTLQIFITNRCNLRCKGCFYGHNLGEEEMSLNMYKLHVLNYLDQIDKVILLGGEPTLYKDLPRIIRFNNACKLRTTIYTNGVNLKILEEMEPVELRDTQIRIGVHGTFNSEKALKDIKRTPLSVSVVYMLTKSNAHELMAAAIMAESDFNCNMFMISSIRDIAKTQDYWKDTEDTLSMYEYFDIVQNFIDYYKGRMDVHISRRAIVKTKKDIGKKFVMKCRFGNIFPENSKIICPMDISKKLYSPHLKWGQRKCNKNSYCILQKVVLRNKLNNDTS